MKTTNLILCHGLVLMLLGCSSAKTTDVTMDNRLKMAIAEVTQLRLEAERVQSDLLSFKEYAKGAKYLKKAEQGRLDRSKDRTILTDTAAARVHFLDALKRSKPLSSSVPRILQARKSSLDAGLRNSEPLVDAMLDVDEDLRDETKNFSRILEPDDFSEFQKRYFALEVKAVQFRELNKVEVSIREATKNDAADLAPDALRVAMLDLNEAENLVAQSPRNPGIHRKSVNRAVTSSVFLSEVMDVILNAKGTPESVALKVVMQNRALGKLSQDVGKLEDNLKNTRSSLTETEGALKSQNEELARSTTEVRFQAAMDEAVRNFTEDEAWVYQQGSKLIFRLKRINFPSGTSSIPIASKPVLSKIDDIIRVLDTEMVVVQGHTDSLGAEDQNEQLSTRRASSVASYLWSLDGGYEISYVGYGEAMPIASNETRAGRAINRRVDLIVTAKK